MATAQVKTPLINPFKLPRSDLTRQGNALEWFYKHSRPEYLEELVRTRKPDCIPFAKMHFNYDWMFSAERLVSEIERGFDAALDRYGSGYEMRTPVIEISQPPYADNNMEVNRLVLTAHYRKASAPGLGGRGTQFHRAFYSNGFDIGAGGIIIPPQSIDDCIKSIERNYSIWVNNDQFSDCRLVQRGSTIKVDLDQPKNGLGEEKTAPISLIYLNRFSRDPDVHQDPDKDPKKFFKRTESKLKIVHFSGHDLPDTYDECRNEKGNLVLRFEKKLNEELKKLHGHGYNIVHYNLHFLANTQVAFEGEAKHHFFAIIQCEKDEKSAEEKKKTGDGPKEYPLCQVRVATDSANYNSIIGSARSQQWLASPINKLALDRTAEFEGKIAGDMLASHITWGVVANLEIGATSSFRVLHSILLKDGVPTEPTDSYFRNISAYSGIFRGPVNGEDPSMVKPVVFDRESNLFYKMSGVGEPEARTSGFKRNRHVHDLEWMLEGAMFDVLQQKADGELKALIMLRQYIDNNFPGPTQGFMCPYFLWQDESK